MKFGGSSVRDAAQMRAVAAIVGDEQKRWHRLPVVVISAMGKTTTNLITAANRAAEAELVDLSQIEDLHMTTAKELEIDDGVIMEVLSLLKQCRRILKGLALTGELTSPIEDLVMSFGERMSARIFSGLLRKQGMPSKAWDSFDLGIRTTGYTNGSSDMERVDVHVPVHSHINIKNTLMEDLHKNGPYIPVITGFIAKNQSNKICTLGRGGSDLTAALLGSALNCYEIQLWTDTNGVLTGDPTLVRDPLWIKELTFEEAKELAYFGAKILHPRSIQPAAFANIPVRVKNSFNPEHAGTLISNSTLVSSDDKPLVTALTLKSPVTLVDIKATQMLGQHGFLAEVFSAFKSLKISVDVIATSEVSISISLDKDTPTERLQALKSSLIPTAEVDILGDRSIIALIGNKRCPAEVLKIACATLIKIQVPVEMVSLGASKLNTSLVVPNDKSALALSALHEAFFP